MLLHELTDRRFALFDCARFEVLSRRDHAIGDTSNGMASHPFCDAEFDVLLVRNLVGFLGSLFVRNGLGKRAFTLE